MSEKQTDPQFSLLSVIGASKQLILIARHFDVLLQELDRLRGELKKQRAMCFEAGCETCAVNMCRNGSAQHLHPDGCPECDHDS